MRNDYNSWNRRWVVFYWSYAKIYEELLSSVYFEIYDVSNNVNI